VSGLESIAQEVAGNLGSGGSNLEAAFADVMEAVVRRLEAGAKVSIAPIVFQAAFDDEMRKACNGMWEEMKKRFGSVVNFVPRIADLKLIKDGVHLNDASAKRFMEHIIESSASYFKAKPAEGASTSDVMDLSEPVSDTDNNDDDPLPFNRTLTQSFKSSRKRPLSEDRHYVRREEFEKMKDETKNELERIKFVSAKQSEELDFVLNSSNMAKFVIYGLSVNNIHNLKEKAERVKAIRSAVEELLRGILDEGKSLEKKGPDVGEVVFVKHLNERLRLAPEDRPFKQIIEVTMKSEKEAIWMRDLYAALNKKWRREKAIPEKFKGIFLNPVQTHRTRVRVEVLKALAKSINNGRSVGEGAAWVVAHLAKPVLKVSFGNDSNPMTLTYCEAVKWTQSKFPVGEQDLLDAYKQAGSTYGESLENTFVILKSGPRSNSRLLLGGNKKKRLNP